jgi:hypothetical protein
MIIIGLGHKARQGKDSAGEAILQHFRQNNLACQRAYGRKHKPTKVELCKFATALYQECREQHGMLDKDPILLQDVGLSRRHEDPEYWVKRAFAAIPAGTDIAIFTDVRFKNEANRIQQEGGHLINVVRMNEDGTRYIATDRPHAHSSETDLDSYNWDFQIVSKSPALTGELAVTIAEFIRGLESK